MEDFEKIYREAEAHKAFVSSQIKDLPKTPPDVDKMLSLLRMKYTHYNTDLLEMAKEDPYINGLIQQELIHGIDRMETIYEALIYYQRQYKQLMVEHLALVERVPFVVPTPAQEEK